MKNLFLILCSISYLNITSFVTVCKSVLKNSVVKWESNTTKYTFHTDVCYLCVNVSDKA